MRSMRWVLRVFLVLLAVAIVSFAGLWWHLKGSLAPLEGEQVLTGLGSQVTVERDAQGIPTIGANNRIDAAYTLGVLHAQERFFQMDLLRRNSAGELSALVGAAALEHDRRVRIHQFRKRAERALATADTHQAQLLNAYTQGVNEGLSALRSAPFEYGLLRVKPQPWTQADSLLVLYSMYLDLQPEWNEYERSLAAMRDVLPADWYQFLTPPGGLWDSPIDGARMDWRRAFSRGFPSQRWPQQPLAQMQANTDSIAGNWTYHDTVQLGSNNWSIAGARTQYTAAMVANDMHLGLNEPNIWYRASWFAGPDLRRVTGATLPGTPTMVVGSNQHIAWGFTNSYGDFHDSIVLTTDEDGTRYLTTDGWREFEIEKEVIPVKGARPLEMRVKLTRWGPVIGHDHNGNLLALRWVAHDVEGANLNSLRLETADNVYQALDIAATAGIPGQNLNVVDTQGNQAWTIMGRLPRRVGFAKAGISPTLPADWSGGNLGWDGYLSPREYPRVINPRGGRIWTANARVVSDALFDKVGDGSYALGARQQQIEQDLTTREILTEKDMLAVALDDRALFLRRWQQLLLDSLTDAVVAGDPGLAELRGQVVEWQGRASKRSVGYRVVKRFREQIIDRTVGGIYRFIEDKTKTMEKAQRQTAVDLPTRTFWPGQVDNRVEYPVWALVEQQPPQHVPAGYDSWPSFIVSVAKDTLAELTGDGQPLAKQTWGKANTLAIKHPLSNAVPFLSRWLDMPAEPMDGDTYMPRVQRPSSGASERMVVAPGHEDSGIFHMATGQSAHPLSPYFSYGHRDWVEGNPSAFLPGETKWTMVLKPESKR